MTAQVAADLRAAADVLRRDGWTQELFINQVSGCPCVAGALLDVAGYRWHNAIERLGAHLGIGTSPLAVYRWNDTTGRTADEVIAALEAAADAADRMSPEPGMSQP